MYGLLGFAVSSNPLPIADILGFSLSQMHQYHVSFTIHFHRDSVLLISKIFSAHLSVNTVFLSLLSLCDVITPRARPLFAAYGRQSCEKPPDLKAHEFSNLLLASLEKSYLISLRL